MKMPGQSVFDMPFLKVYKCHINVGAREGAGTISFVFLNSTPRDCPVTVYGLCVRHLPCCQAVNSNSSLLF